MKLFHLIIAAFAIIAGHDDARGEKAAYQILAKRVDEAVQNELHLHSDLGMALALTDREKLLHLGLYGVSSKDSRHPITDDTLFGIGSIGKSFTAVAMLLLRDDGKLDLMAPVANYIPWFKPNSTAPITAHQLLTHTAGLPNMRMELTSPLYQAFWLAQVPMQLQPGEKFHYSSSGYDVASVQIAAISGQPYEKFIRERILEPLEMTHSEPVFRHAMRPRLATSYEPLYDDRPADPSYPLVEAPFYEYYGGAGSLAATASDLAAYLRMLLNGGVGPKGRLLSEESFDLLAQKAVKIGDGVYYGYAIQVDHHPGSNTIRLGGAIQGFRSVMIGDRDSGLGVVALVNGPASLDIAEYALSCARAARHGDKLPALPAKPYPADQIANNADYFGEFSNLAGNKLVFEAEDGKLILLDQDERLPLQPKGRDCFLCDHEDWALFPLQFIRSERDVVELHHGPRWYVNSRYEGPPEFRSRAEWKQYTGHYRVSSRHHINFRVILRKGQLWFVNPDGSETVLVAQPDGSFRLGESPEWLKFDSVLNGRALRVDYSGTNLHRDVTP
jgi:CubicO group peptidase (beta-lactamase class C family)